MTDSNALLVKPKISKWGEIRAYLAHDFDALDLDHQIYVPERFVLGHFRERKDGFKLSQGGIFYRDSSEALTQYQKHLDDGKMEVVQELLLPESVLETIAQQGKVYIDARKQISESVQSVDQYLV
ncbi:MAG: hypothetical protein KC516_02715 [Nanoarchaeota archaeon]|nr:hypothetical protein [Nanoarchaeota archaeon]